MQVMDALAQEIFALMVLKSLLDARDAPVTPLCILGIYVSRFCAYCHLLTTQEEEDVVPITLISDREEFLFEYGDAKIWYRRVPNLKQAEFEHKHRTRGDDVRRLVIQEMLVYATLRWNEAFVDLDGTPVPVSPDAIAALPDEVMTPYIRAIYSASPSPDPTKASKYGLNTATPLSDTTA